MATDAWDKDQETLKSLLQDQLIKGDDDWVNIYYLPRGCARKVFSSNRNILKHLYRETPTGRKEQKDLSGSFCDAVIGGNDEKSLSNILATLINVPIRPNSASWKAFELLCKQPTNQRKFCDGALPLTKQEVIDFLGKENLYRDNFEIHQYIFSPIVLKRGAMIDRTQPPLDRNTFKIPYVEERYRNNGAHGKVFRVTLAGGHFGLATEGRTICARKDFDVSNPRSFEVEWQYVEVRALSATPNPHILEVFGGLRTPNSLSLFCELADCDLHEFMTSCPKPANFTKFTQRLAQFKGIILALQFLHTELTTPQGARESCFHLDLKPKNVLVFYKDEAREIFKICDFSISRSKTQTDYDGRDLERKYNSVRDISTDAKLADSATCLAPEAFGTQGRVNASNDIWHLGCVLCIFMAWLHDGPRGFDEFNVARYSEQQGADWFFINRELFSAPSLEDMTSPTPDETPWWRCFAAEHRWTLFIRSLEVENWLDELLTRTKGAPEGTVFHRLVQLLKCDLLVVDPNKRKPIEKVCLDFSNCYANISTKGQGGEAVPSRMKPTDKPGASARRGKKH